MVDLTETWSRGRQETINALWQQAVEQWPDRIYLTCDGRELTYREAHDEIVRLARGLADLGVRRGDRVVTLFTNSVEGALVWFAVNHLGAIWVPVNTANKGEFLRHQIADADTSIVLGEDVFVQRVADIIDALPTVSVLVSRTSPVAHA